MPYILAFASSGFIYIAVSHLIPRLQRKDTLRETVPQMLLIALGVGIVMSISH